MRKKIALISFAVLAAALFLASVLGFIATVNYTNFKREELSFREDSLKNDVIDRCLENARVKTPEKDEPVLYLYDICMKDKGMETVYTFSN